jgi:hypothetical protein
VRKKFAGEPTVGKREKAIELVIELRQPFRRLL